MKYLFSIFRISLLIAMVLALGRFGDIKKARGQAGNPDPAHCTPAGPIFECTVSSGSSIPASYEGQNVIIDGATTIINADAVKITAGTTNECSDPSDPNCDSKRHFNSLVIKNGATLTHQGVILDGDTCIDGPPTPGQVGCNPAFGWQGHIVKIDGDINQINGETLPGIRWKKVDLVIDGDLTLESGGKIDVSGKGYPNGYGPGHGLGAGNCPDEKGCAGGGGYGGKGGQGNTSIDIGGPTYGSDTEPIDFGSGAGLSNCGNEFFGGGRIKIDAGSITISDLSSMISANGNDDDGNCEFSPGGPSGGSILLTVNTINTPAARLNTPSDYAIADKGYHLDAGRGTDGSVGTLVINGVLKTNGSSNNPAVPSITNIFAKGGDISRNGGAGGGGRIVILPGPTPPIQSRKVNVTVRWNENGVEKSVNFSEILSDITP